MIAGKLMAVEPLGSMIVLVLLFGCHGQVFGSRAELWLPIRFLVVTLALSGRKAAGEGQGNHLNIDW